MELTKKSVCPHNIGCKQNKLWGARCSADWGTQGTRATGWDSSQPPVVDICESRKTSGPGVSRADYPSLAASADQTVTWRHRYRPGEDHEDNIFWWSYSDGAELSADQLKQFTNNWLLMVENGLSSRQLIWYWLPDQTSEIKESHLTMIKYNYYLLFSLCLVSMFQTILWLWVQATQSRSGHCF